MNKDNHITIDKMTLAVDLASEDTKKLSGISPIIVVDKDNPNWTKYTEEAQEYFNDRYDYYIDMIEQAKV